jgi:MFS superfamily sulfate permease-like transporter
MPMPQMKLEKATLANNLIARLTFALVNIPQSMAHALPKRRSP